MTRLRLLIVEDNPGDYVLLKRYIQRSAIPVESFHWVSRLVDVEPILNEHEIDMAFLDLSLPDSNGTKSFKVLYRQLSHAPIIVLSGLADMEVALQTISLGAQDYLVKGEYDEKLLTKSIQYGLERKKILDKLQESNERYEIVNMATQDIIWDWNLDTHALYLSSSVIEILGFTEQYTTIEWFFENMHPEDLERIKSSLDYTIESKIKSWSSEFRFRAVDGTYKHIFSRGQTIFTADGQAHRIIGAAADVTEKRRLEEELIQQKLSQQKLITETTILAQEKERNELAKELHDNINQILSTVKMYLNIAREDEQVRTDLLNRSYENINHAIEEIRKLSQSLVAPSLGDIGIVEALKELRDEINVTRGLKVELEYENHQKKKLDPTIELMLYRIAQEQVNNIVKYAKASEATITLKTDPRNIILSIADNGVGFDPSQKAKGIGLKNISSRVEFYSGKLNIKTAPGKGCTLEISIPV
jgi:two-component system sensor histidine kinase UhpB